MVLKTNTALTNEDTVFVVLYRAATNWMHAKKQKQTKGPYKKPPGRIFGLFETRQTESLSSVAPPSLYFEPFARRLRAEGWVQKC